MSPVGRGDSPAAEADEAQAQPSQQQWDAIEGRAFRHRFTFPAYLETYKLSNEDAAEVLRHAIRALRGKGWTIARRHKPLSSEGLTITAAISAEAARLYPDAFNLNQAAMLALESVIGRDVSEWVASEPPSFERVENIFYRAIWRADQLSQGEAA